MKRLVIIGAGGFAREIYDLAYYCFGRTTDFEVKGFLSDNPSDIEEKGYPPVLGKVAEYTPLIDDVFFCGIGNVRDRKKCVEIISAKGGQFINLIHPQTVISPSALIGRGVGIKAYCVIASDARIGDFTFLQSSVIAGHDVNIGAYCHVNSLSFFAGTTKTGDLVTINAGARIIQGIEMEEGSTIGIGSVVIKNVRKDSTVFGMPAREI